MAAANISCIGAMIDLGVVFWIIAWVIDGTKRSLFLHEIKSLRKGNRVGGANFDSGKSFEISIYLTAG